MRWRRTIFQIIQHQDEREKLYTQSFPPNHRHKKNGPNNSCKLGKKKSFVACFFFCFFFGGFWGRKNVCITHITLIKSHNCNKENDAINVW